MRALHQSTARDETDRQRRSGVAGRREVSAYYNEIDPFAAQWLRELIKAGLIADGEVDERDINEVQPGDVRGYAQCHFFAGIGGWSYALRLAGWPDHRPVRTVSAPCQPWSVANVWEGGGKGDRDERDLWPSFARLDSQLKPAVIFGEQVADAIRWGWLDRAFYDLEQRSYACAAAVLPAALAAGAAHERKRLYFVADPCGSGWEGHQPLERFSVTARTALTVDGNPLALARKALDGDLSGLLPCDGLSVVMERDALKGYGNAIVPQVGAAFIQAYCEARGLKMIGYHGNASLSEASGSTRSAAP